MKNKADVYFCLHVCFWPKTLISKNIFADLEYSTTVTFPLATFPDIFHPFFLILKSAESALSHFPFWPASPVLLYIFHVFDTMWWRSFWRSILIFVHLHFYKKKSIFSFHILYFSIKIVCILFLFLSNLQWEKIDPGIEKIFWNSKLRPRMCKNFVITRTTYSNSFETECFLTYSWKFLRSNTSEQFKSKFEKIIGI